MISIICSSIKYLLLHTLAHILLKQSLIRTIEHIASRYSKRPASQVFCLGVIGYAKLSSKPLFRLVYALRWRQMAELTWNDIHYAQALARTTYVYQYYQMLQLQHNKRLHQSFPHLARVFAVQLIQIQIGHIRRHSTLGVSVPVGIMGHKHEQRQPLLQRLCLVTIVVYGGQFLAHLCHNWRVQNLVQFILRASQNLR